MHKLASKFNKWRRMLSKWILVIWFSALLLKTRNYSTVKSHRAEVPSSGKDSTVSARKLRKIFFLFLYYCLWVEIFDKWWNPTLSSLVLFWILNDKFLINISRGILNIILKNNQESWILKFYRGNIYAVCILRNGAATWAHTPLLRTMARSAVWISKTKIIQIPLIIGSTWNINYHREKLIPRTVLRKGKGKSLVKNGLSY